MSVKIKSAPNSLILSHMVRTENYTKEISYIRAYQELKSDLISFPVNSAITHGYFPSLPKGAQRTTWDFRGDFRAPEQSKAFSEALDYLNKKHVCILSLHVGFGKTFLALKLAAHIGLKTLIIVPTSKKILQTQWKEEIERFIPKANIQLLSSKTKVDRSADIFIAGSHCILNIWPQLTFIPFCIVDELHLVLSKKGFACLLHIFPYFLLGLSATPFRLDGSNDLVELFFGSSQVERTLKRNYTVKTIFTPFTFKMQKTESGQLNWGAVLGDQANHEERNEMIARIICAYKNIKFLVLCKRVDQIKELSEKCRQGGVAVQAVYEDISPQKDEKTLVGSIQKLGTGFSDCSFKGLIIAADVQDYFIQYFGRVLRDPQDCPLVFDIVDNNAVMMKHFKEREKVYVNSGGKLQKVTYANFINQKVV